MTPEEILKKKLERLETVPETLANNVTEAQKKIFDQMKKSLRKLSVDANGNIELSQENFGKINTILKDYETALTKSGYYDYVDDFVKEFKEQKQLNDDYLRSTLDDFKTSKKTDLIYKAGEQTAEIEFTNSSVNNALDNIRNMVNNSIVNSDNIIDLTENISLVIKGNSQVDGDLIKFISGNEGHFNAKDIYAISERGYSTAISKEFGIQFYLYAGGKMDTSRCFCLKRKGNVYHVKEIEAWGRGEDLGSCNIGGGKWAGEAKGTNENTIFSLLGGYGCVDSLIPKGLKDVPAKDIRRAIDKGYMTLDDLPDDVRRRVE